MTLIDWINAHQYLYPDERFPKVPERFISYAQPSLDDSLSDEDIQAWLILDELFNGAA